MPPQTIAGTAQKTRIPNFLLIVILMNLLFAHFRQHPTVCQINYFIRFQTLYFQTLILNNIRHSSKEKNVFKTKIYAVLPREISSAIAP